MALRLTMGFSDNPRVQPLKDGIVKPQGIELDCITLDPSASGWARIHHFKTLNGERARATLRAWP
jgi:hypothetical protein